MSKKNKTCGECKYRYAYRDDEDCNGRCKLAPFYRIPSAKPACSDFEPIPPPTNGDVIRQGGDKALAEISIYKDKLADGVKVYRSTLIAEKYWLSRACAIRYVECLLNEPEKAIQKARVRDESR